MRIKTRGDNDEVRLEVLIYFFECGFKHMLVLARRRSSPQRNIHRVTLAASHPRFTSGAGTGIPGILMHREEEHIRVVIEDALRAISMVDVPIDNRDPFNFVVI